uniref:Transmembrane protein n=1 Tax=Cacopsylla melanoneura TaxID=428564 RepID=A0A8D8TYL9_9HEMI
MTSYKKREREKKRRTKCVTFCDFQFYLTLFSTSPFLGLSFLSLSLPPISLSLSLSSPWPYLVNFGPVSSVWSVQLISFNDHSFLSECLIDRRESVLVLFNFVLSVLLLL